MTEINGSLPGAAASVLKTLPGQFLALCLVNAIFIGSLFWFLNARTAAVERMLTSVLTSCIGGYHEPR